MAGLLLSLAAAPARADDDDLPPPPQDPAFYACPALAKPETYKKRDGYAYLVSGTDGVLFRSVDDLSSRPPLSAPLLREYGRVAAKLKEKGIDLVILYQPPRGALLGGHLTDAQKKAFGFDPADAFANYQHALGQLRETGAFVVPFEDMAEEVRAKFFYLHDHHWSPAGAQESARRTAALIKSLPVYAALKKTEFKHVPQGTDNRQGLFSEMAGKVCGTPAVTEKVDLYDTVRAGKAEGAADLFGTAEHPAIVLAGTSNSSEAAATNFPGWLRAELSVDVANHAVTAGGPAALLSYLRSASFRDHPPKIIVWESPSTYEAESFGSVLRQAAAVLEGGCPADKSVAGGKIGFDPDKRRVTFKIEGGMPETAGIMDVSFSSPVAGDLKIRVFSRVGGGNSSDRLKDMIIVEDVERTGGGGGLSLLLDRQNLSDVLKVEIDAPKKTVPATATLRFCSAGASIYEKRDAEAASAPKAPAAGEGRSWLRRLLD